MLVWRYKWKLNKLHLTTLTTSNTYTEVFYSPWHMHECHHFILSHHYLIHSKAIFYFTTFWGFPLYACLNLINSMESNLVSLCCYEYRNHIVQSNKKMWNKLFWLISIVPCEFYSLLALLIVPCIHLFPDNKMLCPHKKILPLHRWLHVLISHNTF